MIKFTCSNCRQSINVDDRHAGKKGKCPKCKTALVVPERSTVIEFHCDGCGRKIKVPDRYAGKKGKCPKCQKPVVVPAPQEAPAEESEAASGRIVSEPEIPVPSETDEELYDEPATAPEKSSGRDRRLLILIGGAAIVAVVGLISLVIFLRSSGSKPVQEPVARRPRRDATQAESQPQPVAAEPQPTEQTAPPETASPKTAGAIRLKFRPSPGIKRTVRVTTRTAMFIEEGGQQQDITNTQSVTVDLETTEAHADGTVPISITLGTIQVKTEIPGMTMGEYDSAKPQSEDNPMAGIYVPFVGKRFTVSVSGQGKIVDPGLDELFLSVAVGRMEAEDDMTRELLGERAQAAIEKTDQRFGSRRSRTAALKKQLEEYPILGAEEIRGLLGHLIVSLPDEPVQSGTTWNGPVAVRVGTNLDIPGTFTVATVDEDSCTITAEGQRSVEEEPFVYQSGSNTISSRLGGSSQMRLTVDRQTGWLRAKEQKTTLSGRVLRTQADAPGQQIFSDVSMEITTTVTSVE